MRKAEELSAALGVPGRRRPVDGAVCAVMRDQRTGWLHADADPTREAYGIVW